MSTLEKKWDLREPINLPEYERIDSPKEMGVSRHYGATAVAAAYCGFRTVPSLIPGDWVHGWEPSCREKFHPDFILGIITNPDDHYFVDRKDTEDFLRRCGYNNVRAIGVPIIYLPRIDIRRRPGSLLVMPAHSIEYTTHIWRFDEYADAIAAIRSEFEEVVVCIHPVCWDRGYWVEDFRKQGFQLVKGARADDRNGLRRMQHLLSSFEYVTTNGMGSHIAYAAYFGAKPSVYGPYATLGAEDFKGDGLYVNHPKLVEPVLRSISEEALRRHYPRLFCHPREAKADVEWGGFELGEANKLSPRQMRSLFGWSTRARLKRSFIAAMPSGMEHWARTLLKPSYRESHRREAEVRHETDRLLGMPRHQPTRTNLLGPTLEVQDGPGFVEKKRLLFDQKLYRFVAEDEAPRILDCGAGIGLSVCYFKKLHPGSRISAFEPDPRVYAILKRNCESWGAGNIDLIPMAVWDCETTLPFARTGEHAPGRVRERAVAEDSLEVQTCRLRDFLTEKVDLLRLNIEGAEVDVLLDCSDLLGNVQRLIVEYHSISERAQRFDTLIGLLTKAGFRMHFRATSQSPTPFVYRPLVGDMDSKLTIFAFKL
jgi:FkbM family methyltransferase